MLPVAGVDNGLVARYMLERSSLFVLVVPVSIVGEEMDDIASVWESIFHAKLPKLAGDAFRDGLCLALSWSELFVLLLLGKDDGNDAEGEEFRAGELEMESANEKPGMVR